MNQEKDNDFYCFFCGKKLEEDSLGTYRCDDCKESFVPWVDDGVQAITSTKKIKEE